MFESLRALSQICVTARANLGDARLATSCRDLFHRMVRSLRMISFNTYNDFAERLGIIWRAYRLISQKIQYDFVWYYIKGRNDFAWFARYGNDLSEWFHKGKICIWNANDLEWFRLNWYDLRSNYIPDRLIRFGLMGVAYAQWFLKP